MTNTAAAPLTLFELFDRTLIINLPNRGDRRRETVTEFRRLGRKIDGEQVCFFVATRPESANGFRTIGSHGSLISHRDALKKALDEKANSVLLIEDDVAFSPRLRDQEFLGRLSKFLGGDWDVIYFGHNQMCLDPDDAITLEAFEEELLLSHCVAFHGRVLAPLIDYLQCVLDRPSGHPEGGKVGFDPSMNMFRKRHPNRTFVVQPCLAFQRPSRTDLGLHKWFDTVPGLRNLIQWARGLHSWFDRWNRYH